MTSETPARTGLRPSATRDFPGGGQQNLWRFENGYGASAVCRPGSYDDGLWEVAVLRFHGPALHDYRVDDTTPVADDVLRRRDFEAVMQLLREIRDLPARAVAA